MTDHEAEFSTFLRRRVDPTTGKAWLVLPLELDRKVRLLVVPNTIANRSAITPPALQLLRIAGLPGADIVDIQTGRQEFFLRNVRLGGHPIPDFAVQVRDVSGLRIARNEYLVDGYLGLDVLLGLFSFIALDTRRLRLTLRLRTTPPRQQPDPPET